MGRIVERNDFTNFKNTPINKNGYDMKLLDKLERDLHKLSKLGYQIDGNGYKFTVKGSPTTSNYPDTSLTFKLLGTCKTNPHRTQMIYTYKCKDKLLKEHYPPESCDVKMNISSMQIYDHIITFLDPLPLSLTMCN